jgi:hypothetical protein
VHEYPDVKEIKILCVRYVNKVYKVTTPNWKTIMDYVKGIAK